MKRREFAAAALAAPALVLSRRAHAAAAQVIVGDPSSANSAVGRAEALFKERAEKYSEGGLSVQVYPNSQLGTFDTMATQMKVNLVNVMFIQPDALGGQVPIITANAWPFLFADQDQMLKGWNGPGGKALIAAVEKKRGYRMIAPSWNVPRWVYTTRKANSLDDLKGMKIRVPGTAIYVDQIRLLGMSPIPMNIAQTFTAMQQGVVEGIEGAITDMQSLSIEDVAHTAVMTGHVLSPKAVLVYGPWLDSLSPKNKEAFIQAATDASNYYSEHTKADNETLIAQFKAKGVRFVAPGKTVEQMRRMVEPMQKQLPDVWVWAQRLAAT